MTRPTILFKILSLVVVCALLLSNATAQEQDQSQEEEEEDQPRRQGDEAINFTFRNELNKSVKVFFEKNVDDYNFEDDSKNVRYFRGTVEPMGGELDMISFPGLWFSFIHNIDDANVNENDDDRRHFIKAPLMEDVLVVLTPGNTNEILVRCTTTATIDSASGQIPAADLYIMVYPPWSPRGASQFLEMVREKYLDGVAINRVVPNFLTQFGIGKDYEMRQEWMEYPILDDPPHGVQFESGIMAFAGSGPNSRTTEIFMVMPGTPPERLDHFGTNSWETPFAMVQGNMEEDELHPVPNCYSYGDIPPWGDGPDTEQIYAEDGYEYLEKEFSEIDYIKKCSIVDDSDSDSDSYVKHNEEDKDGDDDYDGGEL